MPAAAYTILRISTVNVFGGIVACDLVAGDEYALQEGGWSPAESQMTDDVLAGRPYTLVEDTLLLDITGASPTAILASASKLLFIVEQARRWAKGEAVEPVVLTCQLQGSELAPLQTLVVGGARELPDSFHDLLMVGEVQGVRLMLLHHEWMGEVEAHSSSSGGLPSTVGGLSWPSSSIPYPGPLSLTIAGFERDGSVDPIPGGYLVGGSLATGNVSVEVIEAEALAIAPFTSVADATNLPRSGSVLRYTPTDTTLKTSSEMVPSIAGIVAAQQINVLAVVRNNTAGKRYLLNYYTKARGRMTASTPVVVELATNTPTVIPLGTVSSRNGHTSIAVQCQAIDTGGTLDIDVLVLQNADDPAAFVAQWGGMSAASYAPGIDLAIVFEDRLLTEREPAVALVNTSGTPDYTYLDQRTNMYLPTIGGAVYLCPLIPYLNYWRVPSFGFSGALPLTLSATRRLIYLTPE